MKKITSIDEIEMTGTHDEKVVKFLQFIAFAVIQVDYKLDRIEDELKDWPKDYSGEVF